MLQNVWNTAKKVWGITMPPYNPFELVTMHKVDNARDRVLTTDEYSKLLDSCSEGNMPVLRDIVIFAYETGARQGEILKLKRSNVDFDKRLCTFLDTKNGEDRTIPLTDAAIEILKRCASITILYQYLHLINLRPFIHNPKKNLQYLNY